MLLESIVRLLSCSWNIVIGISIDSGISICIASGILSRNTYRGYTMYWKGISVHWICSPNIASDSITLYSIYWIGFSVNEDI